MISRQAFWHPNHQRDLLHTLKARWAEMPDATKQIIEDRIFQGPEKWKDENQQEYTKRKAWYVLERLDWLKNNRCFLSAATEKEIARLKKANPEYTSEHAKDADRSLEGRGGLVSTNTEHSAFLKLPLADILLKAEDAMGRHDKFLTEYDPFTGLCETRPTRAFAALRYEAKQGNYRPWAWHKFLDSQKRKNDPVRFRLFIAEVLVGISDKLIVELIQTLAWWLLSESEKLTPICVPVFEKLIKQIITVMDKNNANKDAFITIRNGEPLSFNSVLNSNVGIITEALLSNPPIKNLKVGQILPSNWKDIAEDMLNLPDDLGRHALVIFTVRLGGLYAIDPQWTHDNLLQPLFEGNPDTADAWWAGYLWGAGYPSNLKLFKKIKPYLLARVSNKDSQIKDDTPAMVQFILSNWGTEDRQRISDKEFHKILLDTGDDFRARILWNIKYFCEQDANPPHWNKKRNRLLEKVWPLQIRAKTVQTSERLIDLAFANEPEFPRIAKAIIPLLGESFKHSGWSFLHGDNKDRIVDKHPEIVLEILYKVVPEDVFFLSDRVKNTLDRIATAAPELTRDPRFKELQRRWAAR